MQFQLVSYLGGNGFEEQYYSRFVGHSSTVFRGIDSASGEPVTIHIDRSGEVYITQPGSFSVRGNYHYYRDINIEAEDEKEELNSDGECENKCFAILEEMEVKGVTIHEWATALEDPLESEGEGRVNIPQQIIECANYLFKTIECARNRGDIFDARGLSF